MAVRVCYSSCISQRAVSLDSALERRLSAFLASPQIVTTSNQKNLSDYHITSAS